MIVADTNLIAGATLEHPRSAAAIDVRGVDVEWVSPPIWESEYRNVLATFVRLAKMTSGEAFDAWARAEPLVVAVAVDPVHVLTLAFERGLSGYDAEFVALAMDLGVPLVTDDKRLRGACPEVAISPEEFVSRSGR